jgi:hypothetical protein
MHRPVDRIQEGLIHRAAQGLQGQDITPQDPAGILGLSGIQGLADDRITPATTRFDLLQPPSQQINANIGLTNTADGAGLGKRPPLIGHDHQDVRSQIPARFATGLRG